MNETETRQAAAVMLASETKNIEKRYRHGKSDDRWVDCPDPDWDWDTFEFRIAPEPMEVEVWVHPDGRICDKAYGELTDLQTDGWTLRLATIHPETK